MNKKIEKLDERVVNRIAAGEIVVRPCAAIKELVENSLDAGSHTIQIHVKQGGLKSIEIRDDGCGISKVDLPLVCERFATSKLKNFDDLYHLNTYGFRGEALASLSYAGHVKIVSKIGESQCAYVCEYEDGKIRPSTSIKPCAGQKIHHERKTIQLYLTVKRRYAFVRTLMIESQAGISELDKSCSH